MKLHSIALIALLALPLAAGAADDKETKKFVKADTTQTFKDMAANIRLEMEAGGRFEYIKPNDKVQVNKDLDHMAELLEKGGGSVATMNERDRVTLFNDQENANMLLTHNDSQRLVCEHAAPMGSHIQTTSCRTYGEIEHSRQSSQKFLDQQQNGYRNTPYH